MNSTTIICPHCKKPFEISDAIQHQIGTNYRGQKPSNPKYCERNLTVRRKNGLNKPSGQL